MAQLFKSIIRLFPPVVIIFGYLGFQVRLTYYNFFSSPPLPDGLPNDSEISETLVVACGQDDDIYWLERHKFPVATVTYSTSTKGNEAITYLQYIVDNYETLSDVTIFIHNQESAWHNARLLSLRASRMLAQLDRAFVLQAGYFNLRCEWEPGCPARFNFTESTSDQPNWQPCEEYGLTCTQIIQTCRMCSRNHAVHNSQHLANGSTLSRLLAGCTFATGYSPRPK